MRCGLARGIVEQIGVISSNFISWQPLTMLLVPSSFRPLSHYTLAIVGNISRKSVLWIQTGLASMVCN